MSEFTPTTIPENLLFSTVKIDIKDSDGNDGSATGFIFNYELEPSKNISFVITNKHVIEKSVYGEIKFHEKKIGENVVLLGKSITGEMDNMKDRWVTHPDDQIDIAAMPITKAIMDELKKNNKEIFYKSIPNSIIPSKEELKSKVDAIEEVIFIGYPRGIYDTKNLMPIVRKGISATPIAIDFEDKPHFLIDGAVFPGSSGSPVFICNMGSYPMKRGGIAIGNRILFLGILGAMRTYPEGIEYIPLPTIQVPGMYYLQVLNLGIVYKSNLIIDLIKYILEDKRFTLG